MTAEEALEAGLAYGGTAPPLTQDTADKVAAILMAAAPREKAREVGRVLEELSSTTP